MAKIQMKTPLVEMAGDEMTRILWQMIKDELLLPYIDLKTGCIALPARSFVPPGFHGMMSVISFVG